MNLPLPPLLLAVLVLFLGVLGGLALVATRTMTPEGRTSRGFFGGLASALTLLFLCGMGLAGTGAFVATLFLGSAIEHNPIERVEIRRGGGAPEPHHRGAEHADPSALSIETHDDALHVLISMRGQAGDELKRFLRDTFDIKRRDLDRVLTVHEHELLDGTAMELYELRLPVTAQDLADFEAELERELEGLRLRLPESVAVHFEGASFL